MPRYIDAEELTKHKFLDVTYTRYVSDGRSKYEEEIYAYKVGYNEAIEDIAKFAPTADVVERKTAKWIMKKIYENKHGYKKYRYFCSECNTPAFIFFQPFCHNCGAEMKGKENE